MRRCNWWPCGRCMRNWRHFRRCNLRTCGRCNWLPDRRRWRSFRRCKRRPCGQSWRCKWRGCGGWGWSFGICNWRYYWRSWRCNWRPFRRRWRGAFAPKPHRDHVDHSGRWLVVVFGSSRCLFGDGDFGSRSGPPNISSQVASPDECFDLVLQLIAFLGIMSVVPMVPAVFFHVPLRQ